MADGGYSYPFDPDQCVMTIFTASRYAGEFRNKAAFVTIGDDLAAAVSVLPRVFPHIKIEAPHQPKRPATPRRTPIGLRAKKQPAASPG
jgi:hypothetical protein